MIKVNSKIFETLSSNLNKLSDKEFLKFVEFIKM